VNLSDERNEQTRTPKASKTALLLMAAIVICLAIVAIFANAQRSRRDAVEAVNIRLIGSPTPREH
jgi:hypothetical protein